MKFAVISGSLDANSRSRRLAELAGGIIAGAGHEVDAIDLRAVQLPPFDNDRAFDHPGSAKLHAAIAGSDGIVLASPIYNWGLSGALKNLIEITGSTSDRGRRGAWFDKIVTFVCAGGLPHSYMAYSSLAMSLMLDFKCVINPYQVYATERDWTNEIDASAALLARLEKAIKVKLELADGLQNRTYRSDWEI